MYIYIDQSSTFLFGMSPWHGVLVQTKQ